MPTGGGDDDTGLWTGGVVGGFVLVCGLLLLCLWTRRHFDKPGATAMLAFSVVHWTEHPDAAAMKAGAKDAESPLLRLPTRVLPKLVAVIV